MSFSDQNRIRMIVGLGNPGIDYCNTRHNAGFMVVDRLLEGFKGDDECIHTFESHIWHRKYRGRSIFIQKPLTYMNNSGKAVVALLRKHRCDSSQMLVIYDDMDLPLGKLRIKKNGSSGGHNGIKSIIEHLGSETFNRLRVGIGRHDQNKQIDHVLGTFEQDELPLWDKVLKHSIDAVKQMIFRGIDQTMNTYNGLLIEINE